MEPGKVIIVSNRLPIKVEIKNQEIVYKSSEGGLATGLGSIYLQGNNIWVGWSGICVDDDLIRERIQHDFKARKLFPVNLTQSDIALYYEGFSNDTLWPLFHYFPTFASYNKQQWQSYQEVNQKFADAVFKIAEPNDTIWIHDYQLMLLPAMLRAKMPSLNIGFFQHIPFPSYEVFRLLPWRDSLLHGLMGADLIGFHTYDDARHFMSASIRISNAKINTNEIIWDNRSIIIDAFPMGIDYDKYYNNLSSIKTKKNEQKLYQLKGDRRLIISIDRLDYSKGILQRLDAFDLFLKKYPSFREKVIFIQLIVPSRDRVKQYAHLKEEINRKVSDINARFGSITWQPIRYFYRAFPLEMLSALYAAADIALVTPLRDGMNLVCKEYIASREHKTGVLILSEMAGASKELYEALIINPTNKEEVADAINQALTMPQEEQIRRMTLLQHTVRTFNINHWVNNFLNKLYEVKKQQKQLSTKIITPAISNSIREHYLKTKNRLIFLDYDGTLSPFHPDPLKAVPTQEILDLLKRLYGDPSNTVILISGRKRETLDEWMGHLPVDIVAEHGAWIKHANGHWSMVENLSKDWKEEFYPILKKYELNTPGSFIEEKDFSLAWHYRKVDTGLAELRTKEIRSNIKYTTANLGLQILEGNKVIEIKSAHINKGNAVKRWLNKCQSPCFILAIGDDQTDEDTFRAMPESSFTIKVGSGMSVATFYLADPTEVLDFLDSLGESSLKADEQYL